MYYLAYLSHTYQVKNKLEKTIQDYLILKDRELIQAMDIHKISTAVLDSIDRFHIANPKCKKIEAHFETNTNDGDVVLRISGIGHFKFLKSK